MKFGPAKTNRFRRSCRIRQDLRAKFTISQKIPTESPDVQQQLGNLLPHHDSCKQTGFNQVSFYFQTIGKKIRQNLKPAEVIIKLPQEWLPGLRKRHVAFLPGVTIALFFVNKSKVQTRWARPHQPPVPQIKPSSCHWSVTREDEGKQTSNELHNFLTGSGSHRVPVTPIMRCVSVAGDQEYSCQLSSSQTGSRVNSVNVICFQDLLMEMLHFIWFSDIITLAKGHKSVPCTEKLLKCVSAFTSLLSC